MCSGHVCGRFCGQKRFPPLTIGFPLVLSGKRFAFDTICIVTLMGRFCNGFLPEQALKFCGTISKDKDRRSNRKAQCRMSKSCMGNQFAEEYSKLALGFVC